MEEVKDAIVIRREVCLAGSCREWTVVQGVIQSCLSAQRVIPSWSPRRLYAVLAVATSDNKIRINALYFGPACAVMADVVRATAR